MRNVKLAAMLLFALLSGCSSAGDTRQVSPPLTAAPTVGPVEAGNTYRRLDSMMRAGETISGAGIASLEVSESDELEVMLLNASDAQLDEARAAWPGVEFRSGTGWVSSDTLPR